MEPTEESSRTQEQDFARLQREHENALRFSKEQIQKWEQFKGDYEALQARLYTLPDKLTHDIMVPLGQFAFIPGQLYHTNEILVLLGDNWFAKRSVKQAIEIAERRKQYVSKLLEDEKKQLSDWEARLAFTAGFKSTVEEHDGTVEIKEEYHPEEEKKRRKGKARVQRESRAPPPRQVFPRGAPSAPPLAERDREEEGLWARLEQLEKEEEEFLRQETEGELGRSESLVAGVDANAPQKVSSLGDVRQKGEMGQAPGEYSSLSDRPLSCGQEYSKDYVEGNGDDKPRRKVAVVGDDTENDGGSGSFIGNQREDTTDDEDKPGPLRITITHTQTQLSANEFGEGSSNSEESEPRERLLFTSPADIYTHFCKPTLASSDSEQGEEGGASVAQKTVTWDSKLVSYSEEKGKTSSSKQKEAPAAATQAKTSQVSAACAVPFSGRVVERISSKNTPSAPEPSRKISKFKASRQNK